MTKVEEAYEWLQVYICILEMQVLIQSNIWPSMQLYQPHKPINMAGKDSFGKHESHSGLRG